MRLTICECCGQPDGTCEHCGSSHAQCNAIGRCEQCHDSRPLEEQLATHPGWRWMGGMLVQEEKKQFRLHDEHCIHELVGGTPVLDDPATVGCIIGLVVDQWPTARVSVDMAGLDEPGGCSIRVHQDGRTIEEFHGSSMAEVLVMAMHEPTRSEGE